MPLRHTLAIAVLAVACSPYEELNQFPVDEEFRSIDPSADAAPGGADGEAEAAADADAQGDSQPEAEARIVDDPGGSTPAGEGGDIKGGGDAGAGEDGPLEGGGGGDTPSIDDGDDLVDPPHDGEPDIPEVQDPPERPECVPSQEVCDGVDNDCDGATDEDDSRIGEACDTGDAGACGAGVRSCRFGQLICTSEIRPAFETCDGIDNDCDGRVDDGFDLRNDVRHCGGCGIECDTPGAEPACELGACVARRCFEGFYDLDGDVSNGCEVERAGRTLHVDITAAPGGDGTVEAPFTQITDATAIAEEGDIIEVADGFYDGPVVIDTPFVTLRSDSNQGTWIEGTDADAALQIAASDVRVRRISVDARGATEGVRIIGQDRFLLDDLRIQNVRGDAAAVLILGGFRGQLTELAIRDVRGAGADTSTHGVRVQGHEALYAADIEVEDIAGGLPISAGFTLTASDSAELRDLDISSISGADTTYGLSVDASADARVTGLTIADITGRTAQGVTAFESADLALIDSEITDVAGRTAQGVSGVRSHFAELSGLTVSNVAAVTAQGEAAAGRASGLVLEDTAGATIQRTLIHDVQGHAAWGIRGDSGLTRLVIGWTTIAGVTADADGAGVQLAAGADASITRSIVATGGTRQGIRNDEANRADAFTADHTDSFGHPQGDFVGLEQGEGNLQVDPLFAAADEGDYSLSAESPVRDRGVTGVEAQLLP